MNCTNCGASNKPGSEYCEACGARIATPDPTSAEGQTTAQIPPQLKAMRIGDIFDQTIRLFRQDFRSLIIIAAIIQVPTALFSLGAFAIFGTSLTAISTSTRASQIQWGPIIAFYIAIFVVIIISTIGTILMEAAFTIFISERFLGRRVSVGAAYQKSLRYTFRLLAATLLAFIPIVLIGITFIGIPAAVYLGIRWCLLIQAIVVENKGIRQSLSRSSMLVKDNWWRVLGIIAVAGVAQYFVAGIPGGIISAVLGAAGALLAPGSIMIVTTVGTIIGSLFNILAAPLIPIVTILLYYDLRIRKEGFDLQMLTEQLSVEEPPVQSGV